jgi:nucleoside 2-deoxyribosyltransferase
MPNQTNNKKIIDEELIDGKQRPTIYCSGPMQTVPHEEMCGWRQELISKYSEFDWLDPTRHAMQGNPTVIERDKRDIAYCDAVLAHVPKFSCGTLMEIFFAFSVCGKPVVVVTPHEFHQDVWLKFHCHYLIDNFDDAMDFLKKKLLRKK